MKYKLKEKICSRYPIIEKYEYDTMISHTNDIILKLKTWQTDGWTDGQRTKNMLNIYNWI